MSDSYLADWHRGLFVGARAPYCKVWIRRGFLWRRYASWAGDDVHALMPGQSATKPWQAFWTVYEEYREVPNIADCSIEQNFDNRGTKTLSLSLDNVLFRELTGPGGVFHGIERGALSPWRGYAAPGRERLLKANEWKGELFKASQIRVEQGMEGEHPVTFTGFIDDLDLDSSPDKITITARDATQILTDEHLFGWAKDEGLGRRPTIFADRRYASKEIEESGGAEASSSHSGFPPRYVSDQDRATRWRSGNRGSSLPTEWVEIHVRRGRYQSIRLHPAYAGMEAYISVYAKMRGTKQPIVDGEHVDPGWVDVDNGDVPGENGGKPYVRRLKSVGAKDAEYQLGHTIEVGDNSVIRVSFRNLRRVSDDGEIVYAASVRTLAGIRSETKPEAVKGRWILVEDAADVVRVVLRWAGFKAWEVENTGVRLKDKLTFHQGDFLIDPISKIAEMTNYVFFMDDPDPDAPDAASIGKPIFRHTSAIDPPPGRMFEVRDRQLLTGFQYKHTKEPLAYIIRARGKLVSADEGGVKLGEDTLRRYQAVYRPPWRQYHRINTMKHAIHTDNLLRSEFECGVMCRLIALAQSLKANTALIEIPGFPGVTLDQQVSVFDEGTGANTRLWVASFSSRYTGGRDRKWTTTIGGAAIDSPDVVQTVRDLHDFIADEEADDVPAPYATGGVVQPRYLISVEPVDGP